MGRWIIVSNRLPFSYDPQKKSLKPSSGGLVTALGGIKSKSPMIWIGAVTDQIPEDQLLSHQKPSMQYQPLYIPHTTYEHYYNNFCNDVLWPLLHYECEAVNYTQSAWETYKQVNQLFAQHILSIAKSDDIVWIHDFHLFLVPELLKKANPQLKIGFFLHVPFPSSEVYRQLPCRIEILRSLIHSDLVGFHDFSYLRHFASAIHNVLGVHNSMLEVIHNHHICKLGVYPVSIDTLDFIQKAESKITAEHLARYAASKGDSKFLLGVDRLDYTKGILLKLHAFRELLTQHPELVGKVQLIQIAVPSRIDVPEYAHLRDQVEMLVGQINGQFSTINYVPVKYIFSSVNIYELMALYRLSDILFVTSKRDGMNLVCLEYVTAQRDEDPGVVVLSEFTGAASTLSHATLINPNDISGTASALYQALHMPLEQRQKNNHIMLEFLKNYNASDWAGSFIKDLLQRRVDMRTETIDLTNPYSCDEIVNKINSRPAVLMLDYDGTLAPIYRHPEEAIIDLHTKSILERITQSENKEVVIISGRPISFLTRQFQGLNVYIAGEHGGIFYDYKRNKWRTLVSSGRHLWYPQALEIIRMYTKRTPNSFVEKKDHAVTWHFRNSPNDFGEFQARKLVMDLEASLVNMPVHVIKGKKVVEVKAVEANKGYFASWFCERFVGTDDLIVAIGDDRTDEDMFASLGPKAVTIKVGDPYGTSAKYNLAGQSNVIDFLSRLSQAELLSANVNN